MRTIRDEDSDHDAYTTIDNVLAEHATAAALLVRIGDARYWIPQSVIGDDSEVYEARGEGKLVIRTWFARKAGLAQ
jgi:hypothetical protein